MTRSEALDAFRLTTCDQAAITAALVAAVDLTGPRSPVSDQERHDLTRTGLRAIGCTVLDMRTVELAWLDDTITLVAGLAPLAPWAQQVAESVTP